MGVPPWSVYCHVWEYPRGRCMVMYGSTPVVGGRYIYGSTPVVGVWSCMGVPPWSVYGNGHVWEYPRGRCMVMVMYGSTPVVGVWSCMGVPPWSVYGNGHVWEYLRGRCMVMVMYGSTPVVGVWSCMGVPPWSVYGHVWEYPCGRCMVMYGSTPVVGVWSCMGVPPWSVYGNGHVWEYPRGRCMVMYGSTPVVGVWSCMGVPPWSVYGHVWEYPRGRCMVMYGSTPVVGVWSCMGVPPWSVVGISMGVPPWSVYGSTPVVGVWEYPRGRCMGVPPWSVYGSTPVVGVWYIYCWCVIFWMWEKAIVFISFQQVKLYCVFHHVSIIERGGSGSMFVKKCELADFKYILVCVIYFHMATILVVHMSALWQDPHVLKFWLPWIWYRTPQKFIFWISNKISHWTASIIISPNKVLGDIMVLASPLPPVDPDDMNPITQKKIQPISFKFYMWVDTPVRYFAIEIWYSPGTRTTAFAAKWHLYPPNLQNAISP